MLALGLELALLAAIREEDLLYLLCTSGMIYLPLFAGQKYGKNQPLDYYGYYTGYYLILVSYGPEEQTRQIKGCSCSGGRKQQI